MSDGPVALQEKRALLVGINAYPNFPPERQLRGCLNDVALLRGTLHDRFGFPEDAIIVLTDDQATRDGILAAMQRLADECGPGDVVLFYYSGHGSQLSDREGDEPDFFDETIIPSDSGRSPHKNRDITDDEIYLWLRDLGQRTGNITLWFDCCNSGSLTRAPFGGATRSVPRDDRPVSQLPESPIPRSEWDALKVAHRVTGPSGWAPVSSRYVMIAACRDEQTANEYPPGAGPSDEVHGCLTFYLHQELMNAGPGTTYQDVFDAARRRVSAAYPDQTPQLEGNRDRILFGLVDLAPARFIDVKERAGTLVTLEGGLAHAVQVGSQWAIYPAGTKQPGGPVAEVGTVAVEAAGGLTSTAKVVKESSSGAIAQGCRAFETDPGFGRASLVVNLAPSPAGLEAQRDALVARLSKSSTVRAAQCGEASFAQVVMVAPRGAPGPGDPVGKLAEVRDPIWAVIGGGGQPLMPPKPVAAVDAIVESLETIARYNHLLAIRNPGGALKGKVKVTLIRKRKGEAWQDARPDAEGRVIYQVGAQLAFRVVHTHTDPLFLNVLDFTFTYKVGLIYPPAHGANEVLVPLLPFEFGKRQGQHLFLKRFPEDYEESEGRETLKMILANRPIDFSWMRQVGLREQPLSRAVSPEEWTTVEAEFVVVRE